MFCRSTALSSKGFSQVFMYLLELYCMEPKYPWPVNVLLGVVEGFYGPPWGWVERLSFVEFLSRVGLNAYIYGPKWDPYHREWWRAPYGEGFLDGLSMLVEAGLKYGVEVVFAVSPGLDVDYSSESDALALVRKLSRVMELGIDSVAVFLDDIPSVLRGRGFRTLAEAQAHLVNRVLRELRPRSLILCPTYYYGIREDYLRELGSKLDPEVRVMWTGMWVASHRISEEDLTRVAEVLGRKPFIWDNYPVNDYFTVNGLTRLHIGPVKGRVRGLTRYVSGYVANLANQPELSKVPVYTIAEALQSEGYNPDRSLEQAIDSLVNRSARYYFKRFAEFNKATFMDLNEETVTRENSDEVLEVVRELRDRLSNRELLREVEPVLSKMESIARYARGEVQTLSWRVQTAGEYDPPITAERMMSDVFGVVARRIPWYSSAYRKPWG